MPEKSEQLADQVAPRLRAALKAIDKNQTDIANFLDVGPNRINQFCKGKRLADLGLMIRLCDRYGLTLDWLYRGDPSSVKASIADALIEAYRHELNHSSQSQKSSRTAKKKARHAA